MFQRHVAQWGRIHPLNRPLRLSDFLKRDRQLLQKRCPHLVEQIVATAKTSRIPEEELFGMNFRIWNFREQYPSACSILAFHDPHLGLVVGNTLDDPSSAYQLAEFRPTGQHRFTTTWWIGSAWAASGFNHAGLIVAQSSMVTGSMKVPDPEARLSADFLQRELLATCSTVDEAEKFVRSWPLRNGVNLLLADKLGNIRLFQCCPIGIEEISPVNGVWAVSNHVISPTLRTKMEAAGYIHQPTTYTLCRMRYLVEELQEKPKKRTLINLLEALSSTQDFPDSIANPRTAYTLYWKIQHEPGVMHYVDGPAIHCKWQTFEFK